jgi:hypothetical protein
MPDIRRNFSMKKLSLLKSILLLAIGSTLLNGCVVRERTVVYRQSPPPTVVGQEVVVSEAPPPMIVETQTIAPGPDFIWIGGVWAWHGHWVWEHGHWGRPPHPGAVWVAHRYEYRNGVHVYIRGGWRF